MDLEPLWRVLVAAALSIPVGLDRELRGKSAGLRTHAVVAAASAALGYLSVATATSQGEDATRIASQVVTGIGFMGAGVIFASQGRVHGLTTAAALWSAMATGLCVGMGATGLAVALVAVTLLLLGPVNWVSDVMVSRWGTRERQLLIVADDLATIERARELVMAAGGKLRSFSLDELRVGVAAQMLVRCRDAIATRIDDDVQALPGIRLASTGRVEDTND